MSAEEFILNSSKLKKAKANLSASIKALLNIREIYFKTH